MHLSEWREQHGISQAGFAALVQTTQPSISRAESFNTMPSRTLLHDIYRVTGGAVTANDFIDNPDRAAAA